MANTNTSQTAKILNYLTSGKTLTVEQARTKWGVRKLSARICDLRNRGYNITTVTKTVRGVGEVTAYTLPA